jgi:hypothetical protein
MSPSLLHGSEDTNRVHTSFDGGEVSLLEEADGLSSDHKLPILSLVCAIELVLDRIILEHVQHVIEDNERTIDDNNIHFAQAENTLVTRYPIRPDLFIPTYTIMSQGCR